MASVNKVIADSNHTQPVAEPKDDPAHEKGPALLSLPGTGYLDRLLGVLTKHSVAVSQLTVLIAVVGIVAMAFKMK